MPQEFKCPSCSEKLLAIIADSEAQPPVKCLGCEQEYTLEELDEMIVMLQSLKDWITKAPFNT